MVVHARPQDILRMSQSPAMSQTKVRTTFQVRILIPDHDPSGRAGDGVDLESCGSDPSLSNGDFDESESMSLILYAT
jgi:hypothetical protein